MEQRRLSRRRKGSANRGKQRIKVAKVHRKIREQRRDFAHKLSRRLVNQFDLIAFEKLQIPNMMRNHHLAKSIADSGWNMLQTFTAYKAEEAGTLVKFVDPNGTSLECCRCGISVPKNLSTRTHTCLNCGLTINRDWIRRKWKVRRGYLKIHIAVDTKSKRIISMGVTDEKAGDGKRLRKLVREASGKVKVNKVLGDDAYDSKENFKYLADRQIEPCIRVRKNSSGKAGGCMPRKLAAQEYLQDPEAWKRKHRYGQRWMVESAFSSLKRTFGEYVSARKIRNMAKEMMLKASLYNLLIGITATIPS